ncbi:uncharacterized protein [Argopecten irradians]|uniref:uncharacterized protein n=1 Tax=Argopecten irradians TaxID=31199 RepID=UPI003715D941
MSQAVGVLNATANELDSEISWAGEICERSPYDHTDFQSGNSMTDTLHNGVELISEIALNMTIINCHRHRRFSSEGRFNVHQPMRTIICEMRKLMRFTIPIERSKFRASISLEFMDTTDTAIFTCQNLRRAMSAVNHLKNDIIRDFENTEG